MYQDALAIYLQALRTPARAVIGSSTLGYSTINPRQILLDMLSNRGSGIQQAGLMPTPTRPRAQTDWSPEAAALAGQSPQTRLQQEMRSAGLG